jgi:hypothetical protein
MRQKPNAPGVVGGEGDEEDLLVHDGNLDPVGGTWQWLLRDHSRVGDVLILLRVDLWVTHLVLTDQGGEEGEG